MDSYPTNLILPYTYIVTAAISQSGTVTATLTMAADSAFELLDFVASSDKQGQSDVHPNYFSCQITDQATGRQLSSARVPQRMLCGTSYISVAEKYPIRFPASCVVLFDFLDLNASGTNNVTLGMRGYKVFQTRQP